MFLQNIYIGIINNVKFQYVIGEVWQPEAHRRKVTGWRAADGESACWLPLPFDSPVLLGMGSQDRVPLKWGASLPNCDLGQLHQLQQN